MALNKINKLRKIISILICLSAIVSIYAVPKDSAFRFLDEARKAYSQGDVENAYKYVNQAFVLSTENEQVINEDLRESILYFAQSIYSEKLLLLLDSYNEIEYLEIEANLERYPRLQDSNIKKLLSQIKLKQKNPESSGELEEFQKSVIELDEKRIIAAESKLQFSINENNGEKEISDTFKQKNKVPEISQSLIIFSIISLSIIGASIILIIVTVIKRCLTHKQLQQKQFVQVFDNSGKSNIVNTIANVSTEQSEVSKAQQQELKNLSVKCEELGNKIDAVTGRKNNSKNVSEIVYKLSLELNIPPLMTMINFCASLIYDAGFLGIDPDLLTSVSLNEEEKEAMKTHVSLAKKYIKFVPKKYYSIFEDAATKHHENMDGSGYPRGLSGGEIPQIARLIRVAESFISLSSKRLYHAPMDKEAAVAKLKENPQFYDPDVVAVLEKIV